MRLSNYPLVTLLLVSIQCVYATEPTEADKLTTKEHRPIIRLSATAQSEVPNDLAAIQSFVEVGDANAAVASGKVTQLLQLALTSLGKENRGIVVRTSVSVNPLYHRDGKTNEWKARAVITLEGSDFAQLSKLGAKLGNGFAIQSIAYRLSDAARIAEQGKLSLQAIELFRAQANQVAEAFGYKKYDLVNIDVNSNAAFNGAPIYRLEARSMAAMASTATPPAPLESGEASINSVVSGTIGLVQ
jgi:predicted secreted protein